MAGFVLGSGLVETVPVGGGDALFRVDLVGHLANLI